MLTYVSGLALVFAGMIIGYFLSQREKNSEDDRRTNLSRENADLRDSLERGKSTLTELEEKYSRQNGQLAILQQLCDDWSTNRDEADQERNHLQVTLTEYQTKSEQLAVQLQEQSAQRRQLEDQLHKVQQAQAEQATALETSWLQRYSGLESELHQRNADLKQSLTENERTAKQLHSAEARIAVLMAELETERTQFETASTNVTGLKQEYTTLETTLREAGERLKDSEAKCARAISAKNIAEESLAAMREQAQEHRDELAAVKGELAGLAMLRQQFGSVESALASSDERLRIVASERDKAIGAERAAHEHILGLQKQIENQESTIQKLRRSQEESLDKLRREIESRADVEKEVDRLTLVSRQESEQLSVQVQTVQRERDELAVRQQEELAGAVAARELLIAEHLAELADRDTIVAERDARIDELTRERDEFMQQVDQANSLRESLEQSLQQVRQSQQHVEASWQHTAMELETAQAQLSAAENRCDELQKTIESGSSDRSRLEQVWQQTRDELANANQQCERLESQLADWQVRATDLEASLAASGERDSELVQIREQLTSESHSRVQAEQRNSQLENSLRTLKARCDEMMAELVELQSIRDQHAVASEKWKEYRIRLEQTINQRDLSMTQMNSIREEMAAMRKQLENANETIIELRARLAELEAQREANEVIISLAEARKTVDVEYGGQTRVDVARGRVFTERPQIVDDLKLISGVAEVLEGKLNEYGVYTFRQIMEWNSTNIAEFQELLPTFKDRIERDDWVYQAAQLYEHYHGDSRRAA